MYVFKPNELERRVDEVLFYNWDPIGVSPEPYARAEYLCKIESESMELSPNIKNAIAVAELLKQHKEVIDEGCA